MKPAAFLINHFPTIQWRGKEMAYNRENWKTTVTAAFGALAVIVPMFLPAAVPICQAAQALALALFGYFAADKPAI
jgi:hypothetical protein